MRQYPPNNNDPWLSPPPPPPYSTPTVPNYNAPYQRQAPTLPQRPPLRMQRARAWWGRQRKGAQAGMGCGCLVVVLLLCSVFSTMIAAASDDQTGNAPTPTATSNTAHMVAVSTTTPLPTATLTAKPTATPTPKPTAKPTPRPTPKPKPSGVNGNPWGYNFTPGNLIYSPPAAFCSYFACISSFWSGRGFVNECADETYSKSGGIRGDCSHHGGELQPLYSH